MISSYQDALTYLYENLPMFQRVGAAAIRKDLTNTYRLCSAVGDPQLAFKSVHVAGTNGKGSTCHMLASVFQAAGYKTGLYTSPHLKEFTERIKVNGIDVSQAYVLDFVNRIKPYIEEIRPSFFEITVCMAFDYFAREKVDVAIVEVGLGGRLDSTNVITPVASVITNISWDHMDILGNTLEAIAAEKAGIIKRGIPVVISERQPEVADVFVGQAREKDAPLFFASDEYSVAAEDNGTLGILLNRSPFLQGILFPLKGLYQYKNIPGVIKTIDVLAPQFAVTPQHITAGLQDVITNTGLKGRWQILAHRPRVICDTGHNPEGIRLILDQLQRERFNRLFIVWGMVKDKDTSKVLAMLPKNASYYFCQARIPRALDADLLKEQAAAFGLKGEVVADVNAARLAALRCAAGDDLIFIGGSTYVVAEIEGL